MALIIQPAKYTVTYADGQAPDCLTLAIKDGTGAYSASNTGGYGLPNPTTAAVAQIQLWMYQPNVSTDSEDYEEILLTGLTSPLAVDYAAGTAYIDLTSITTGQSTSSEELNDGVWSVKERVWYTTGIDNVVEIACTTLTTTVTSMLATAAFTQYVAGCFINMPDGEDYEVVTVTSSTSIQIYPAYAGSTLTVANNYLFSTIFVGITQMACTCNINTCMTGILGQNFVNASEQICDECQNKGITLARNAFIDFQSIKAMEAESEFDAVQTGITIYETKYCGDTTDCNC